MSVEHRFIRNPDVSCRPEEPEGGILYHPIDDRIELVNMTGLTIWRLLQGRTLEEIVLEMKDCFDDPPEEQLEKDVKEFLDRLVEIRFVIQK